jgi:prolipoprotein diacylglyceryltransferase
VLIHSLFDLLAVIVALVVYRICPVSAGGLPAEPWRVHRGYIAAGAAGATLGAYFFGSLNLWLTGIAGIARSIEGAIAGGIVGIELLKRAAGIRGSTGLRFVAPLAAAIAVGRIGCFLAGLGDMTYGTPSALPWSVDFGDGVPRHPVQLYESLAMAAFLAVFALLLRQGGAALRQTGFYLFVGVYAAQRFAWEFLKPYGTVVGPFNIFHLLSLALIAYAVMFARRELNAHVVVRP